MRGNDDFFADEKPKKKAPAVVRQDSDAGFGNIEEEIIDDVMNHTGDNKRFNEEPFEEEIIDDEVDNRKPAQPKANPKKTADDSFNKTKPTQFKNDTASRMT